MSRKIFCAQMSQESHDPYIGTAPRVDIWLLIEYTGAWESKAVEQSTLSSQVKDWISAHKANTPHFTPIFIRQHSRPLDTIRCFVGIVREDQPVLYRFTLQNYEELLTLDLAALSAGDVRYADNIDHNPLYLVCTHGKHDMCCAKYGMPIYHEFTRLVGAHVWQCSHLGGDKFAANIVCLPQSIYYGRITLPDVETVVKLQQQDQILLEKCRGQTCYQSIVQAANLLLRKTLGNQERNALTLVSSRYRVESDDYQVTFCERRTQDMHHLTVSCIRQEIESFSSCKGCWFSPISTFTVKEYHCTPSQSLMSAAS